MYMLMKIATLSSTQHSLLVADCARPADLFSECARAAAGLATVLVTLLDRHCEA